MLLRLLPSIAVMKVFLEIIDTMKSTKKLKSLGIIHEQTVTSDTILSIQEQVTGMIFPPQNAVSVWSATDFSLGVFYPFADHNKACNPTKPINVRCKKSNDVTLNSNTQSYGLLNQPQCWAIPTECMIKQLWLSWLMWCFGS